MEATCAILSLRWWRWEVCPGQIVGLETGLVGQRVLCFCCTCLKLQSQADLKGLEVDSLVIEPVQVSKAPRCPAGLTGLRGRSPLHKVIPPPL